MTPLEKEILDAMVTRRPELKGCVDGVVSLHMALVRTYDAGGKLLTCGNGGSHADAVHIVGELCKSFDRKRPLAEGVKERLASQPRGDELAQYLEGALPAVALGLNGSLKTAVENDSPLRDMAFAQEALALATGDDVLLAISTSGNADNCLMAMSVAKAMGATAAVLTGPRGGIMGEHGDVVIRAPGTDTKTIQENHIVLYHTICGLIEARYFPDSR